MSARDDIVDANKVTGSVSFTVPTKGLAPGKSMVAHVNSHHVMDALGISHPDIANVHKLTSRVITNGVGSAGVSTLNKCGGICVLIVCLNKW
jgi:hypothetical protein